MTICRRRGTFVGMHSLRHGWTHIVRADDYELHMANIGQAQANAVLVRDLVLGAELPKGAKVVFAGAGPGQMFEYSDTGYLRDFDLTFTDINESFLERLAARAQDAGLTRFKTLIDDIESTNLEGPVSAAVLVLVLEHVDWKKALDSMAGLEPECLVIVVQRNPEEMETMVAPHRELPGSLNEAAKCEKPSLIDQNELIGYLSRLGLEAVHSETREVPDGKAMCGYVFERKKN